MRGFFRGLLGHWLVACLLWCGVPLGGYWLAEWIFGPYRHWTLWIRGPISTVVTAAFLWAYVGRHLWAARKRTGWW
ncbi:MAG TPA: hypothetical protein VGK92_10020 [Gaiellales bacterium]